MECPFCKKNLTEEEYRDMLIEVRAYLIFIKNRDFNKVFDEIFGDSKCSTESP